MILFSFSKSSNSLDISTTITCDNLELSALLSFNFLEISTLVSAAVLLKPLALGLNLLISSL